MGIFEKGGIENLAQNMADELHDPESGESKQTTEDRVLQLLIDEQEAGKLDDDDLFMRMVEVLAPGDVQKQNMLAQKYMKKPFIKGAGHREGSDLAAGN